MQICFFCKQSLSLLLSICSVTGSRVCTPMPAPSHIQRAKLYRWIGTAEMGWECVHDCPSHLHTPAFGHLQTVTKQKWITTARSRIAFSSPDMDSPQSPHNRDPSQPSDRSLFGQHERCKRQKCQTPLNWRRENAAGFG